MRKLILAFLAITIITPCVTRASERRNEETEERRERKRRRRKPRSNRRRRRHKRHRQSEGGDDGGRRRRRGRESAVSSATPAVVVPMGYVDSETTVTRLHQQLVVNMKHYGATREREETERETVPSNSTDQQIKSILSRRGLDPDRFLYKRSADREGGEDADREDEEDADREDEEDADRENEEAQLIKLCESQYHLDSTAGQDFRAECPTLDQTSALLTRMNAPTSEPDDEDEMDLDRISLPGTETLNAIELQLALLMQKYLPPSTDAAETQDQ
ncbi:hypothetical protein ACFLX2_00410 [Candidatus Dependentiae bacterium]